MLEFDIDAFIMKEKDHDGPAAIELMEKTAEKYKSLGTDEYDLAYSSMMGIMNYVENRGKR